MSRKYCLYALAVAAILTLGLTAAAQATTVLFSDNFNGANNGAADYGLNSDPLATRHSAGGGAYQWAIRTTSPATMDANQSQVCNANVGGEGTLSLNGYTGVNNGFSYPSVIIQHDFAADLAAMTTGAAVPGFTIRYDIDPVCLGSTVSTHSNGGGVGIGVLSGTGLVNANKQGYYYEPGTDAVFTTAGNGIFNAIKNTPSGTLSVLSPNTDPARIFDTTPRSGTVDYVEWYTCEIRVATSSFAVGTPFTLSFWVGPQGTASELLTQMKIKDASMPGMSDGKSYSSTWDADGTCFIDFSAQGAAGYGSPSAFDNIVITGWGTVPEPSTLALLAGGLVGLLAYAWRKRK